MLLSVTAGDDLPEADVVEAAPAAGADDHGNNAVAATFVATNSVTAGDLEEAGDVDWFSFSAKRGDTFDFEVDLGTLDDSFLRLFDDDDDELESNNDAPGLDNASRIADWIVPNNGQFFIEVSGFLDSFGSYDLLIDVIPEDHGNNPASATAVSVGSAINGAIETNGDVDWFSFPATQGQVLILQTTSSSAELRLIDRNATTQLRADDDGGPGSPTRIEWEVPVTGTYFLEVSGAGGYALSVDEVIDDHGDSAAGATHVTVDSVTPGIIEIGQDVDWFSFQAVQNQLYLIRTELDSLDGSRLRLIDGNGSTVEVDGDFGGASRIVWAAPQSQRYFLEVSSFDAGRFGGYSLSLAAVTDDHGDDADGATAVAVDSFTPGNINFDGDVDWFSFSASRGDSFDFEVSLRAVDDSFLRLIDVDGETELEEDDDGGLNFASRIADWTAPSDGQYFLEVSGFGDTFSYDLTIDVTPEDHGNDSASATPVSVGSLTGGVIEVDGDVDWFRFSAQQGQVFILQTTTSGARLRLIDRNGTTHLRADDDGGAGSPVRIEWEAPTAGTYFLEVSGFGSYGVLVEQVIDDHGNTSAEATAIVGDTLTPGIIEIGQDVDWFSFQAVKDQIYVMRTQLDSLGGSLLRLIDPNGSTPIETDGASGGASRIIWAAPASGRYFLEVSSFDAGRFGSYRLSLAAVTDDHGDNADGATAVAVDSFALGNIDFGGDVDWFSFQTVALAIYELTTTLDSLGDSVLSLIDPDGEDELETEDVEGASRIVWIAPTADTYYLEVSAFAEEVGDYRLDVTLVEDDHSNRASNATSLTLGAPTAGEIEIDGDSDWFSFSAQDGEVYVLRSVPDSLDGSFLRLISPSGNESRVLASDSGSGLGGSSRIEWTAPATDTYFLIVTGFGEDTGTYTVEASLVVDDHGSDADSATPVDIGAVTAGEIEVRGDLDWFRFSTQTGRDYLIEVDPDTLPQVRLSLFGAGGAPLIEQRTGFPGETTRVAFRAGGDGERFIRVGDGVTNGIGTYDVTVVQIVDDHGDTFGASTRIEVEDPPTDGVLGSGADVDWFRFQAEGGKEYILETTLLELDGARLRLFDTDGTTLLETNQDSGRIIWMAPPLGGRFFAEVSAEFDSDFGSYQFDIRLEEDDHGDNDLTATPVESRSSTAGEITTGDVDWFSFQADQGSQFDFEVRLGTLPDSVLRLIDDDGDELEFSDDAPGLGTASRIAGWIAPTTGTFFLEVSGFDQFFDTGSYFLDVIDKSEPTLVGDLTGNGFVDFEDLTVLLANWNQAATAEQGNLTDPDGSLVDFEDLTVLLAAWTGPGPAGAPAAGQWAAALASATTSAPTPELADAVLPEITSTSLRRGHVARRIGRVDAPLRRLQAVAVDQAIQELTAESRFRSIARRRRL